MPFLILYAVVFVKRVEASDWTPVRAAIIILNGLSVPLRPGAYWTVRIDSRLIIANQRAALGGKKYQFR
jgi:hypothetical protein